MAKCLIIYHSYHHGNTEKLAREMAKAVSAELCTLDKIKNYNPDDFDTIGFGSGIAYGKHYEHLIDAVVGMNLLKKNVFVFSTCGSGNAKQNKTLIGILEKQGANVAGSFTCKGFDTYGAFKIIGGISKGHPDDADFEAARSFIKGIVK